jgi:hypothetical protein
MKKFLLIAALISSYAYGQNIKADSLSVNAAHRLWFDGLLNEDTILLSRVVAPEVTLRFPGGGGVQRGEFMRLLQSGDLLYNQKNRH